MKTLALTLLIWLVGCSEKLDPKHPHDWELRNDMQVYLSSGTGMWAMWKCNKCGRNEVTAIMKPTKTTHYWKGEP